MDLKKYHGPYRLYLLCLMGMAKVGPDYEIAKKKAKNSKIEMLPNSLYSSQTQNDIQIYLFFPQGNTNPGK